MPDVAGGVLRPIRRMPLFDLVAPGSAMSIRALPTLADGPHPQAWARAIREDHPAAEPVLGIRYRSAYNGGTALVLWGKATGDCRGRRAASAASRGPRPRTTMP